MFVVPPLITVVVWRSARESRARASERSRPQAITLAIMESNCGGMTSPGATPVSTLMPGPVGRARCSIRPGAGAKSRSGSSAVSLASMACPKAGGSAEPVSASVPPAAMCNCSLTMLTPVVASVTGCSTCNRVLTSRNDSSRSLGWYRNSTVPALTYPAALTSSAACERSSFSCSVSSAVEADSSMTFWLRRCTLQSRTPSVHTVPSASAMT